LPPYFIQLLVDMANANNARMDGTMRLVLELIAENDVVFGVWPESSEPGGAGLLVVKGANRLRGSSAKGVSQACRTTAIECIVAEQAEALRLHVNADPIYGGPTSAMRLPPRRRLPACLKGGNGDA
jgi:hypothetical protein